MLIYLIKLSIVCFVLFRVELTHLLKVYLTDTHAISVASLTQGSTPYCTNLGSRGEDSSPFFLFPTVANHLLYFTTTNNQRWNVLFALNSNYNIFPADRSQPVTQPTALYCTSVEASHPTPREWTPLRANHLSTLPVNCCTRQT